MKTIVENVHFVQDGTMVFGDLYLENGIRKNKLKYEYKGIEESSNPIFVSQ